MIPTPNPYPVEDIRVRLRCHCARRGVEIGDDAADTEEPGRNGDAELKLYSIYAPPEHPDGTVHETKADADAAEAERGASDHAGVPVTDAAESRSWS